MSGWTSFLVVAAVILVGCLAVGAWMDHQARKREARGSRSRLHMRGGSARWEPTPAARPRWDDRPR